MLARVLAGAGGKLGPRVARIGRIRLCWKLFQCGRLRVGAGVRVGGRREPRASLSGPSPALRDPRPAFGCCALILEFPSGSFLGSPWGRGAIRLGSALEDTPGWGSPRPGLVRGGGALFAGQGLAPGGRAGMAWGRGGETRTAGRRGLGGLGSPWARATTWELFGTGTGVSRSGRPWGLLQLEPV